MNVRRLAVLALVACAGAACGSRTAAVATSASVTWTGSIAAPAVLPDAGSAWYVAQLGSLKIRAKRATLYTGALALLDGRASGAELTVLPAPAPAGPLSWRASFAVFNQNATTITITAAQPRSSRPGRS